MTHAVTDLSLLEGCSVGSYRLGPLIGIGGTSAVYAAERTVGRLGQRVAIKLLDLGDSEEEIAAFEHECEALTRAAHPNIPRLLEFGITHYGGYYLVLELVDGISIDTYCNSKDLDINERLQLFLTVLHAVVHAHRRGAIHGDIKCSNILVDAQGNPKLVDFGMARLDVKRQFPTRHTWLTPGYAAPESYAGEIYPESDIYSLGAVLKLLLTGQLPDYCPQGPDREFAPAAVNATAEGYRDQALTLRKNRLVTRLPRDLSCIIQAATHPSRTQRYTSPEAFAEDLQAYLDCRPVRARGGRGAYRILRFAQRTRRGLFILAVCAMIAAGLSVDRWRAVRRQTSTERGLAAAIAAISSNVENAAIRTADREQLLQDMRGAALRLLDAGRLSPGTAVQVARLLAQAGDTAGNPTAANVGQIERARSLYTAGMTILERQRADERTARAEAVYASLERRLGDLAAAEMDHNAALGFYHSAEARFKRLLSRECTEDTLIELIRIYQQVGFVNEAIGRSEEALSKYEAALACGLQLRTIGSASADRSIANAQEHIAKVFEDLGDHKMAEERARLAVRGFRQVLAADPLDARKSFDLASALLFQGDIYARRGRTAAEGPLKEAVNLFQVLVMSDPDNVEYRRSLAQAHLSSGNYFVDRRRMREGRSAFSAAIQVQRALAKRTPAVGYDVQLFAWIALTAPFGGVTDMREVHRLVLEENQRQKTPSSSVLDLLARSYASLGDYQRAIEVEEHAIESLPSGSDATEYRNMLAELRKKCERAIRRTQRQSNSDTIRVARHG
jgi:tetratricopeptide (TPR) repeat protein